MKLKFITYRGVRYLAPTPFDFCYEEIEDYESFCGAGKGIGDRAVPENIGGKKCSHICHIHDFCWFIAMNSVLDFMISNAVFMYNFTVYLFHKVGFFTGAWMVAKVLLYVGSVSTVGYRIFKNLKREQYEDFENFKKSFASTGS